MSNIKSKLTQVQYADLQKYVPESDTVKMVFEDTIDHKIKNWPEAIEQMIIAALDGDADSLFDLLELTYLNAQNEGMLGLVNESSFDGA